jgi:hypothetical protein
MRDPNWFPKDSYSNVYNQPSFERTDNQRNLKETSGL